MSNVQLNGEVRDGHGKAVVGRIRRDGKVPCIMYGVDDTTVSLAVDSLQIEKMLSASYSVIDLKYDGQLQGVVVRDIQYHPVKGNIIHVDFLRVKAGQEIKISVPVRFIGESEGVRLGGVFQELMSEIAIVTLPKNLPEVIEVDISELNVNDAIHVKDLVVENFTIEDDPTDTVCSVVPPKKIEEEVVVEDEEGEGIELEEDGEEATEPEVITAKKTESEE
jgi:large subunit ribosomal protein L25